VPGGPALGVHAERDGIEPLHRGLLLPPVGRRGHECLDGALRRSIEAVEWLHDLAARENLDPKPPTARLLDDLRQLLGCPLQTLAPGGPALALPPLDLRLRDDIGRDGHGGSCGGYRPTCLRHEPSSAGVQASSAPSTATFDALGASRFLREGVLTG